MEIDEEIHFVETIRLDFEVEIYKAKINELFSEIKKFCQASTEARQTLRRIGNWFIDSEVLDFELVYNLAVDLVAKFDECEELKAREKKLERSLQRLSEENRDIGNILRVALSEKAAVERSLRKMKMEVEQRRFAILQIAERGLQKVGFGFMLGSSIEPEIRDQDDEVDTLASTVEETIKNLRIQNADLKQSLDESRSDLERLQNIADERAQKISEYTSCIESLEKRENMLTHNVDELKLELRKAEEEVVRWREACELEVEAGRTAIQACEQEIDRLKYELQKTKVDLDASQNKLEVKEKLVTTAMAAQAASEATLRVADRRATMLHGRIEELMRQLQEENGNRWSGDIRKRARYMCWPWPMAFNISSTSNSPLVVTSRSNTQRFLDMEAL